MANKQVASLFRVNTNLCEINREYPCLNKSSHQRHLNTNFEPLKSPGHVNVEKLLEKITSEYQEGNNKHPKTVKDQTEIIELFPEEINEKLYRKCRYQIKDKTDDEA